MSERENRYEVLSGMSGRPPAITGAQIGSHRVGPVGEVMIRIGTHSEVLEKQIAVLDERLQFASRGRPPKPARDEPSMEARAAVSPLADELERIDARIMNALENLRAITEALEL
jgi:hypothetical protein